MKKICLLFAVALIISYNVYSQTSTNSIINFRNYEWGTPMSAVLEREGVPNDRRTGERFYAISVGIGPPRFFRESIPQNIASDLLLDTLEYWDIQVAGYECIMSIYFYNGRLVFGKYEFLFSRGRKDDLINKLRMQYGEPINEGHTIDKNRRGEAVEFGRVEWRDINLSYFVNIEEAIGDITIGYSNYNYFIEQINITINRIKNDKTGL